MVVGEHLVGRGEVLRGCLVGQSEVLDISAKLYLASSHRLLVSMQECLIVHVHCESHLYLT